MDDQIKLLEDLAKKQLEVKQSPEEAKALLMKLGLMTKKGNLTKHGKAVWAGICYTESKGGYKGPGAKYE